MKKNHYGRLGPFWRASEVYFRLSMGLIVFAFGNFPMARVGVEHGICLIIFVMSKMVFCAIGEIGMLLEYLGMRVRCRSSVW